MDSTLVVLALLVALVVLLGDGPTDRLVRVIRALTGRRGRDAR